MSLIPVPFSVKSLQKGLQTIARYLSGQEFPEKALLLIKKAGNPILVWDEENGQIVDLASLISATPTTILVVGGPETEPVFTSSTAGTIYALTSSGFISLIQSTGFVSFSTGIVKVDLTACDNSGNEFSNGFFIAGSFPSLAVPASPFTIPSNFQAISFNGGVLDAVSVDAFLNFIAACLDGGLFTNITVDLSGGTNAAPTPASAEAISALVSAGNTILIN